MRASRWIPIVACLLSSSSALGQGRARDYARARDLPGKTRGKVLNLRLIPHWLDGGSKLWYKRDTTGGGWQYVLVDTRTGVRGLAFDHAKLAASLGRELGKPAAANKIPIDWLQPTAAAAMLIRSGSRTWECSLADYSLREKKDGALDMPAMPSLDAPRQSRSGGEETAILFVNRTRGPVSVFWIDTDGQRRPYGTLNAGEQREQHTFAGHVWLVADSTGRTLGIYEGAAEPTTAVIGVEQPRQRGVGRSRRPNPPADVSPDGKWRAFLKDGNLWLRDVVTGMESALTQSGKPGDGYDGSVNWSPDSAHLVAMWTVAAQEHKFYMVESSPADQVQPKLHTIDYLKPGDRIAVTKPHLFDVAARKEIPVADTLFPTPWEISDIRWNPDSRHFTFVYNQRGHQVLRVIAVDAATGAATPIVDEHSSTFIDYAGKYFIQYLDATHEIVWMSERDGWNHLYLIDADSGKIKNQITRGQWVVRGVDRIDPEKRQVWFHAGGIYPSQDPYYVQYSRVNLDSTRLTMLTEGDGTHSLAWSPDGRTYIDTWSRVDMAPVHELRRAEDGKRLCVLERADSAPLTAAGQRLPERFVAKGRDGHTDIYGVIIRPTTFDPKQRYPVIENIYAGPQSSFVPKAFAPYLGMQELAELGFIVVQIDGMGTSNRSKAFHSVCWKNLGDAGLPDRIPWMKAAAARYPQMDLTRVGIYGGSAGGQNALRALLVHPEFYKVGVADCGCHDNRMDKIWWNELWMGWPVGPEYADQSNVTQAHRLHGKLLLGVGELDSNVDPASTMQVVNALIKANKDFELLVIPGANHGCLETPYGRRRRQDFLVRNLLHVEPRANP